MRRNQPLAKPLPAKLSLAQRDLHEAVRNRYTRSSNRRIRKPVSANPYLGNPIADIIKAGFEASSDIKMWNREFGFDVWKAHVVDREGLLSSERKRGNFSGYDLFWWDIISKHNCIACVSLNYQGGPVFLLMHGYKNSSGWHVRRIEQIVDIKYFIPLQTGPDDFSALGNERSSGRESSAM